MMLVGMTPSTHDGRRKLLTGVDGGELTGETETSSGADPLRFDAATDIPSSSDDFAADDSPGRATPTVATSPPETVSTALRPVSIDRLIQDKSFRVGRYL